MAARFAFAGRWAGLAPARAVGGDFLEDGPGRAGARVLASLGVGLSRHTALRALLRLPVPVRRVPAVIGVDDFALRKRQRYATVIINAETGERVDVLADRTADTLEAWLRDHPGVHVVCRDGSGAYAEAIRRALPDAVQVAAGLRGLKASRSLAPLAQPRRDELPHDMTHLHGQPAVRR